MNRRTFTKKIAHVGALMPFFNRPQQASKPTLHLFLAVDFSEASRKSDRQNDLQYMQAFLSEKATNAGMTVAVYQHTDSNFTPKALLNAINQVQLTPNSGIAVYFSGHGANLDNSNYPSLNFGAEVLAMQVLADAIQRRKPRLCLVIADCCNNIVFRNQPVITKSPPVANQLLREVFWDFGTSFKGIGKKIMVCAAQRGEVSVSNTQGSVFQHVFRQAFDEVLARNGKANEFWLNLENLTNVKMSSVLKNNNLTHQQLYKQNPRITVQSY